MSKDRTDTGRRHRPRGDPGDPSHRRLAHLALGLVLAVAGAILVTSLSAITYAPGVDEGHYLRYVTAVSSDGPQALRSLFDEYLANEEQWLFPSPLRIGFITIGAVLALFFSPSFTLLSGISIASHLTLVAVTYVYSARHFSRIEALLIAALTTFSPLYLALGRRALVDSFATLTLGLTVWLLLDLVVSGNRPAARFRFAVVFGFAILTKETNVLFLVPALAFLAVDRYLLGNRLEWRSLLVPLLAPPAAAGLLFAVAAGGIGQLAELASIILRSPATNEYAIRFGSGPWYRYIIDFMLLSPVPTLMALAFIATRIKGLLGRRLDRRAAYFLVVALSLFVTFNFFTKNVRYVAILDLPIRIFCVLWLLEVLRSGWKRPAAVLAILAVAALSAADFLSFQEMAVAGRMYDPVSYSLLGYRQMIPF